RSPEGLISTGFIAASAGTPAAAACSACPRPISAPPGVTAELSAMFWALNGATRAPRRASQRQIPAVSSVLPASDDVPATSRAPRARGNRTSSGIARPDYGGFGGVASSWLAGLGAPLTVARPRRTLTGFLAPSP